MKLRRVVVTALVLSAAVFCLAGCNSSTSATAPAGLSSTPPAAPSNLSGAFNESLQADYLIWTVSSSPTVTATEIWQYSDNPAVNTGTLVATVPVGESYVLLPAPTQNDILLYRTRARTSDGLLSAFSATITLQRHGAAVQPSTDPGNGSEQVQLHN